VLDAGSLQFSYSVLAAAAITHVYSQDTALSVSGQLEPCPLHTVAVCFSSGSGVGEAA